MKFSISTYSLFDLPIDKAIEQLVNSGWKSIEMMCEGKQHGEQLLAMNYSQLFKIGQFAKENGVSFGLHLPINKFNPALGDEQTVETWNNCLRIVRFLEIDYVLLHPGVNPSVEEGIDSTSRFIKEMLKDLPKQMNLVIENVPNGENVLGTTIDQLLTIIQKVDDSRVSMMLDTGHCYMNSKEAFIQECRKSYNTLFGIHISDNHGQVDEHLAVGEGEIPFKQMIQECKDKDIVYVLETNTVERAEYSRQKLAQYVNMVEVIE
nr:sugar phosphate isomerase/epimerase family protein [Lysinibacillus timonensis]